MYAANSTLFLNCDLNSLNSFLLAGSNGLIGLFVVIRAGSRWLRRRGRRMQFLRYAVLRKYVLLYDHVSTFHTIINVIL